MVLMVMPDMGQPNIYHKQVAETSSDLSEWVVNDNSIILIE